MTELVLSLPTINRYVTQHLSLMHATKLKHRYVELKMLCYAITLRKVTYQGNGGGSWRRVIS